MQVWVRVRVRSAECGVRALSVGANANAKNLIIFVTDFCFSWQSSHNTLMSPNRSRYLLIMRSNFKVIKFLFEIIPS